MARSEYTGVNLGSWGACEGCGLRHCVARNNLLGSIYVYETWGRNTPNVPLFILALPLSFPAPTSSSVDTSLSSSNSSSPDHSLTTPLRLNKLNFISDWPRYYGRIYPQSPIARSPLQKLPETRIQMKTMTLFDPPPARTHRGTDVVCCVRQCTANRRRQYSSLRTCPWLSRVLRLRSSMSRPRRRT